MIQARQCGGTPGGGWSVPPTDVALNHISQEFTHQEIAEATKQFHISHRLGEGSYGTVHKGVLRDGTEVAIKTLAMPKEGGFREEVEVLSRFRHPNLVILLGFARNSRGERYLIYELLPGGDLHGRLEKDAEFTGWFRINVGQDAALGLSYLHGFRPQVFHRDVKTQNILMDRNGTGKVADFGLACLAKPHQNSLQVQQTSGTIGYADPLYIRTGVVNEKSEVYSFGMVMLEMLTGRPPALQHPNGSIEMTFEHIRGDMSRVLPMVDSRGKWPNSLVDKVCRMSLCCICDKEEKRPSFVDLVTQLRAWCNDDRLKRECAEKANRDDRRLQAERAAQDRAERAAYERGAREAQAHAQRQAERQAERQVERGDLRRGSVEAQIRSDRDRAAWAGGERQEANRGGVIRDNGLLERRDATPTRRAEWADRHSMERGPYLREQVGVDRRDAERPVERRFAAGVPPNQGSGARDAQARGGYGFAGGARQSAPEPRRVDPRPVREDPRQADPRQSNPRQADQRQADPRPEVRPEVRPEAQPPSTNSAMLESLSALGFTRKQCDEALKRFSSMEAAVQWIVENSDD